MASPSSAYNKKAFLKFAGLYVATVLAIAFIITAYTSPAPVERSTVAANRSQQAAATKLTTIDESLHRQLQQLQQTDETLLQSRSDTASNNALINSQLVLENSIKQVIDSIEKTKNANTNEADGSIDTLLSYFKGALNNRDLLLKKIAEPTITTIPGDKTNNEQIVKLENELRNKDQRIAALENKLNTQPAKPSTANAGSDKLQEEIKFLKWALRSQVATNKALNGKNQKLTTQVNDLKKYLQ